MQQHQPMWRSKSRIRVKRKLCHSKTLVPSPSIFQSYVLARSLEGSHHKLCYFRSQMPTTKGFVLVTGCSDGGIGSDLALSFVRQGYHVFAASRNITSMSKLDNLDHVTLVKIDVEDAEQIYSAVETVRKETGGILSYLISNAGQNRFMPLLDENIEECKRLYQVNLFGPLMLVQAFAPLLVQAKGTVVFTSSVSGYLNVPWQGGSYPLGVLLVQKCRIHIDERN
jgi:short-subunit dehydrogenase involved in D-alanine esterification of teichoic acids